MFVTTRNSREPALAGTALERRIGRLFSEAFGNLDWQYGDSAGASWVPPVDILEEPEAIRIMAEVPGVKPENVKISLENNVLTIHGSKEQITEERTERVDRYERTHGTFERSLTLPTIVDATALKAT